MPMFFAALHSLGERRLWEDVFLGFAVTSAATQPVYCMTVAKYHEPTRVALWRREFTWGVTTHLRWNKSAARRHVQIVSTFRLR